MMTAAIANHRSGRCLLHLACLVRRPRTAQFHFAGIHRELGHSTYYPTPPWLPIGIALALALMTWLALR